MQTVVAYVGAAPVDAGCRRVEEHYRRLHETPPPARSAVGRSCGLLTWDSPVPATRWPTWARRGPRAVASPYVPIGADDRDGTRPQDAPFDLVDRLVAAPPVSST